MNKDEFIEQALKANEEKAKASSMSDLADPNSSVHQKDALPKQESVIFEKPAIDIEGFPVIPQLRTLTGDVGDAVKNNNLSMAKIALAEEESKREEPTKKTSPFSVLAVSLISILFLSSISLLGFSYWKNRTNKTVVEPETQKENLIISARREATISPKRAEKRFLLEALNQELSQAIEGENIKRILVESVEKRMEQKKERASFSELLLMLEADLPENLRRSLYDEYYLGSFYKDKLLGEPFLLIFGSSFDAVYPGMLEWEKTLGKDMEGIFGWSNFGTSTPVVFKDRIIANKDARVIYNEKNEIHFYYSIVEGTIVIFARSPDAILEISKRIRETKLKN